MSYPRNVSQVFTVTRGVRDLLRQAGYLPLANGQRPYVGLSQPNDAQHTELITVTPEVDDGVISDVSMPGGREERFTVQVSIFAAPFPDEDAAFERVEHLAQVTQRALFDDQATLPVVPQLGGNVNSISGIESVVFAMLPTTDGHVMGRCDVRWQVVCRI